MAPEQHVSDVEIEDLVSQLVVTIRSTIRTADLGEAVGERLAALSAFLQEDGAKAAGPPYVRYHTFNETETDFEIGIPVAAPVAAEGRLTAGELPGGPAIATWHIGPHQALGDAYARLNAWLSAHGREPAGPPWEVYYWIDLDQYRDASDLPDATTWRTRLIQPIKPA